MTSPIAMTGVLDPRSSWEATECSLAKAVDVVHNRSTFLLLREAFYGATRFEEFSRQTGLSEPVTAARLRDLTGVGLLVREPYQEPGQRTRHRYRLTEMGADLLPAVIALVNWGDRWLQEDGPPVTLRHQECGESVSAQLRCAAGHPVGPGELDLAYERHGRPRSAQVRPEQ